MGDTLTVNSLHLEPTLDRDWIVHGASGVATSVKVSAVVTPIRRRGDQWKVGGIACYASDQRFWHLAFVESPDSQGAKHFFELSEMRNGQWNAQSDLADHFGQGGGDWQYGRAYRFKLSLGPEGVSGEVIDGNSVLFSDRRDFNRAAKPVDRGRAALTSSNMVLDFSNVEPSEAGWSVDESPAIPGCPAYPNTKGGFFRTQTVNGKSWFIDPAGKQFLAVTTDHVNYDAHFCEALGYAPFHRNLEKIYGSEQAWAPVAIARLKGWGFNSLAAGATPLLRHRGLPYTEFLSFGSPFTSYAAIVPRTTWTGWPDVFDARWPKFCRLTAAATCSADRTDPWLIGYTLDNELEWWGKSYVQWGIAEDAWRQPKQAAGKLALVEQLKTAYGDDVTRLNGDFGSSFGSFDEILESRKPPYPVNQHAKDALMGFVAEAADRYFRETTAAIRAADPNHLILGCRFAFDAPEPAIRAAGKYCDVVTVNIYPRVDLASGLVLGLREHIDTLAALCGRPIFVTEWGFPGLDAVDSKGVPVPSTQGAGMRVDTQSQRAICFRDMQTALFGNPHVVGSSFFMYADEPALGISKTFPENSNYGLVSEADQPYQPLVSMAADVNRIVAAIHGGPLPPEPRPRPWLMPYPADDANIKIHVEGSHYCVETLRLKLEKDSDSGNAFDCISLRTGSTWENLGSYGPVIWVNAGGNNDWQSPNRVEKVERFGSNGLRLTVAGVRARTTLELKFFAGAPYFLSRVVSIQSVASDAFSLRGYMHYPLSRPEDASSAQPYASGVPNYWLPIGAWITPKGDFALGAVPQGNEPLFTVTFWRDVSEHADFLRSVGVHLKPFQAWKPATEEPWAAIFLTRVDARGKLDLSELMSVR